MHPSIQVEDIPEMIDIDSFHLRLALHEFLSNITQRVGDAIYQDAPLYKKLMDEAVDYAQEHESVFVIARENYLKGLRYINTDKLVPLSHPWLEGLYRVPVKVTKEKYRVFVGKNSTRLFTKNTIPPEILAKLVMATSTCKEYQLDKDMYEYDLYACLHRGDMSDVGWRESESMYVVVLTDTELNQLKGGKK